MSESRRLELRQLTSTTAKVFIWILFASKAILAIWTIDDVRTPWPTLLSVALFGAVALLFTLDKGERLSLPTTIAAAAVGPVSALLVCWQLTAGGFAVWFGGAAAVTLFYVAMRGRIAIAWASLGAMAVVTSAWGATTDVGLVNGLSEVVTHTPVLIVGTLFAIGLQRTGEEIVLLAEETADRAAVEASAAATRAERDQRLHYIDRVATPLLTRLLEDPRFTDEDRTEFMVIEAQLRDSIRARSLDVPEIAEAAMNARKRGVTVILLDDSGSDELDPSARATVVDAITSALNGASDGQVTARLLPSGRSEIATIVADGSTYAKREIAAV